MDPVVLSEDQATTCSENQSGIEERHAALCAKLDAQTVARREAQAKRREEVAEHADPRESVDAFLARFHAEQGKIEAEIAKQLGPNSSPSTDPTATSAALDSLSTDAFQLEHEIALASYYLPMFDQKHCLKIVGQMKDSIANARTVLIPKKKFSFAKKVSRVKGQEMSAAGASATQGAGPNTAGSSPMDATTAITPSEQDVELVKSGRGLMGLRDEVMVWSEEKVGGQEVVLIDLQRCTIYLAGHMKALRMLGLVDCRIVTGPVTGPCFVDSAQNSNFYVASFQVRIHRSTGCDFYLRVRSQPIIEHSNTARFAPYEQAPNPQIEQMLTEQTLGLDDGVANSMFNQVLDFGWIKATQSPNWSVLPDAERVRVGGIPTA